MNKLQGNVYIYIYIYVGTISIFATLQLTHIILDAKQTVNPTIRMCFRRSISYFCGCSHVVSISRCKEPVQCRATTIAKKKHTVLPASYPCLKCSQLVLLADHQKYYCSHSCGCVRFEYYWASSQSEANEREVLPSAQTCTECLRAEPEIS